MRSLRRVTALLCALLIDRRVAEITRQLEDERRQGKPHCGPTCYMRVSPAHCPKHRYEMATVAFQTLFDLTLSLLRFPAAPWSLIYRCLPQKGIGPRTAGTSGLNSCQHFTRAPYASPCLLNTPKPSHPAPISSQTAFPASRATPVPALPICPSHTCDPWFRARRLETWHKTRDIVPRAYPDTQPKSLTVGASAEIYWAQKVLSVPRAAALVRACPVRGHAASSLGAHLRDAPS